MKRASKKRGRYTPYWETLVDAGPGRRYFDGYVGVVRRDEDGRASWIEREYFEKFIEELRVELQSPYHPEKRGTLEMLERAVNEAKGLVDRDEDVDLVRAGYRIARALAFYESDAYYLRTMRRHRELGTQTKQQNLAKRDQRMRQRYRKLKSSLGDLDARRTLRDEFGLTLERVTAIVTSSRT